jgi:hypothetical protein
MTLIDRRGFLAGAAGAAAGVAGVAWWARAPAAASSSGLSARRGATFRTLVRSLRDAPDGRFGVVGPVAAEERFARWYAAQGATMRAHADAVLDAVGERAVPRYRRLAHGAATCRGPVAAPRSAAVAAAVSLVEVVCEPPLADDERPPVPPLELPP